MVTGPWGGKRAADQIDKDRSSSPLQEQGAEEEVEETGRPAKKRKSLPEVEMRVCLTGYKRWVGDKTKEDNDKVRRDHPHGNLLSEPNFCDSGNFASLASTS